MSNQRPTPGRGRSGGGAGRSASADSPSVFECLRSGDRFHLRIRASLPPEWCGNLALHCWAAGIGIASGRAVRGPGPIWLARFDLIPRDDLDDPSRYDFVRMARRRPLFLPSVGPVHLDRIAIAPIDGSLSVRLRGRDELGLLARLLETFASLALEPRALDVRTDDGIAHDWFLLGGAQGQAPSGDAPSILRARLAALSDRP